MKEKQIDTFKLDYGSLENLFLIRIFPDEMVQLGGGDELDKVNLKVFPSYHATIGFNGLRND